MQHVVTSTRLCSIKFLSFCLTVVRLWHNRAYASCYKRLVYTYPDIFENGVFFSVYTSRPHVNGVFGHKNGGFWKCSPDCSFLKTVLILWYSCGRSKTKRFRSRCRQIQRKKSPLSKISGYVWTRPKIHMRWFTLSPHLGMFLCRSAAGIIDGF